MARWLKTLLYVIAVFIVLGLIIPVGYKFFDSYWGWAFRPAASAAVPDVECPACPDCECPTCPEPAPALAPVEAAPAAENADVDVSCVRRAEFGEKIAIGTVTWDAETRVWELKDFVCDGPYCYDYSKCTNPEVTMARQPYRLGYEVSPVNGKMFQICHDFNGACAR